MDMRRRRRGKGRRNGLPIVIGVLALLLVLCLILFRVVFVVRDVSYSGQFSLNPDEMTRASGIRFGSSVFRVDEGAVRENINSLGTVALEGMEIRYPSTVSLHVRDRVEAAMFVHSSGVVTLDADGVVVQRGIEVPNADLLYVSGFHILQCRVGGPVDAQGGQREAYAAVAQALIANNAKGYVSELNVDSEDNMYILTRGGITVRLGGAENMNNKIAWMRSAVADLEARGQHGGTLDVQSGNKADYTPPAPVQTG